MAIIFTQQRKKQRYLIILIIIILIALIFIWWKFLIESKKETPTLTEEIFIPKEIKINFDIFNNSLLQELQPLEEITPFGQIIGTPTQEGVVEKIGRDNPFLPYYQVPSPSPSPSPKK